MCYTQICPRFECWDEHTIHTCVYCVLTLNAGPGRGVCVCVKDFPSSEAIDICRINFVNKTPEYDLNKTAPSFTRLCHFCTKLPFHLIKFVIFHVNHS